MISKAHPEKHVMTRHFNLTHLNSIMEASKGSLSCYKLFMFVSLYATGSSPKQQKEQIFQTQNYVTVVVTATCEFQGRFCFTT